MCQNNTSLLETKACLRACRLYDPRKNCMRPSCCQANGRLPLTTRGLIKLIHLVHDRSHHCVSARGKVLGCCACATVLFPPLLE